MRGLGFILALILILMAGALAHADAFPSILARPIFARILMETPEGLEIAARVLGRSTSAVGESELGRVLRTLRHPDNRPLALDLAARASEIEAAVEGLPAQDARVQRNTLRQMSAREFRLAPAAEGVVRFQAGETHALNTAANLDFIGWDARANVIEDRFIEGDSAARDRTLRGLAIELARPRPAPAALRARAIRIMEFACESVESAALEVAHLEARRGAARPPEEIRDSLILVLKTDVRDRLYRAFSPADWNRHERLVTQYRTALLRLPALVAALEKLR